jgi:hypothetical protein
MNDVELHRTPPNITQTVSSEKAKWKVLPMPSLMLTSILLHQELQKKKETKENPTTGGQEGNSTIFIV